VYLVGFSNGGFMSYRMACERADRIAAIVSLAGAAAADAADCSPSEPVSVLQIHGTADAIIGYEGGAFGEPANPYPGARQSVEAWAAYNRCADTATPTSGPATTEAFDGCPTGIGVQLWTLNGAPHWLWTESTPPGQPDTITSKILEFLAAHPKP
jgi:polyhydroxybutyrate depolymerase